MVEGGGGGVTLEVVVKEGEIPVSHTVEITLTTNDQSANGELCYKFLYCSCTCFQGQPFMY